MEREPAQVWPLAHFLAEEMAARNWTSEDVAKRMDGELAKNVLIVDMLLCIQDDGLIVDRETCEQLGKAFSVSAEFFSNLHDVWKRWPDRREPFEPPEQLMSGNKYWRIPANI